MSVKVSSKYKVVIPKNVRKTLGIQVGTHMEVIARRGIAYLVPVADVEDLQTALAGRLEQKRLRVKRDRKI